MHEKLHDARAFASFLLILSRFPGRIIPEVISDTPRKELPCKEAPLRALLGPVRNSSPVFPAVHEGRRERERDDAPPISSARASLSQLVFHPADIASPADEGERTGKAQTRHGSRTFASAPTCSRAPRCIYPRYEDDRAANDIRALVAARSDTRKMRKTRAA